jgi:NADH:ubiquinone oxidoreductase subunit 4 (subunit M)
MKPVEALTLVPLGALVVVFGLWPGLILDLIAGSVGAALAPVQAFVDTAGPIALGLWR